MLKIREFQEEDWVTIESLLNVFSNFKEHTPLKVILSELHEQGLTKDSGDWLVWAKCFECGKVIGIAIIRKKDYIICDECKEIRWLIMKRRMYGVCKKCGAVGVEVDFKTELCKRCKK